MLPEDLWVWSRYTIGAGIIASILFGATYAAAPGLQVVGPLTSTDTERAEFMVAIGNGVMCKVNDEAIFKRQVEPLIGQQVVLTLVAE